MFNKILILTAILQLVLWSAAANPILVEHAGKIYDGKIYFSFFADQDHDVNLEHLSSPQFLAGFQPSNKKIPNFGLCDKPVWTQFEVKNHTDRNLYLEIRNPDLDSITLYKLGVNGAEIQRAYYGNLSDNPGREIKNPYFYLDLDIDPGTSAHYLVRFSSNTSAIYLPLSIGALQAFFEQNNDYALIHGIYFGLILFIFIYHVFLFMILRKYEYLSFAVFVLFSGLLFAIINGLIIQTVFKNWMWLNRYTGIIGALGGLGLIGFTAGFLKTRINMPKRHIWLLALAGVYVLAIIVNLYGASAVAVNFIQYNTIFTLLFAGFVAITSMKNGFKPARYYLLAISFLLIGFIFYFLADRGLIGINFFTNYSLQIGTILTIVLMTFALGKKINIYIDKRDEARALAIKTNLQNERLIAHHHQLLESRVTERTKDLEHSIHTLQKQRKELEEANIFKDKVFSVISHDLKSPLSTLGGLINVLKTDNIDEDEKGKILSNVELALKNTRNLLDNILIWATKEHNKDIVRDSFDLHQTVDDVFNLFHLQAEAKSIRLINSTPEHFFISVDENMLRLVLRNLISNAIKFTEKHGIVEIRLRDLTPDIHLIVKDTGVGMTEEDQRKLFNNQHPYTTRGTNNEKGTGLGLLLCKEFVEKNGGDIQIKSKKMEGTAFIITLRNVIRPSSAAINQGS